MSAYSLLFDFDVKHDYFANHKAVSVRFEPHSETAKLLKSLGLIERRRDNGIALFFEEGQREALRLYAEDEQEPLQFVYKAYVDDPLFERYTTPMPNRSGKVLRFKNDLPRQALSEDVVIHPDDRVSEVALASIETLQDDGLLTARDGLLKPSFLLQLAANAESGLRDDEGVFNGPHYMIHFAATQSYWKYFLLGDIAKRDAYIVDLSEQVEFEPSGEEALANQQIALTYVSKEAIAMQQRSECRFQLRESSFGGGKVLIKRLPVASANQVGRGQYHGKEVVVSEIYVNC